MSSEQNNDFPKPLPSESAGHPYRAVAPPLADPQPPLDDAEKAELLEQYRSRIFGLGVFWILIALYSFWTAVWNLDIPPEVPPENRAEWYDAAGECALVGAIYLASGLLACRYRLVGVFCGLTLAGRSVYCWAAASGSIFDFSLGFVLLIVIEVGQSLRVFAVAWPLYHAGVRLRSDPVEFRPAEPEQVGAEDEADDLEWQHDSNHPAWNDDVEAGQ